MGGKRAPGLLVQLGHPPASILHLCPAGTATFLQLLTLPLTASHSLKPLLKPDPATSQVKEYQDSGYVLPYTSIVFVVVLRRQLLTAVIDTYVRLLQTTTSL